MAYKWDNNFIIIQFNEISKSDKEDIKTQLDLLIMKKIGKNSSLEWQYKD